MSQNTSSAVMQQRAARDIEGDDELRARFRKLDYFPTPPWAARAGAELIKALDPEASSVWEPACGMGHMSEPLREYFPRVVASDIHPYFELREDGAWAGEIVHDFLEPPPYLAMDCDWIVTNPPFLKAAEFARRGLEIANRGVALLCRIAFLEGAERYRFFYGDARGALLTHVAPFAERVAMQLGSWDPKLSSATAYAWFLFMKEGAWPRALHPYTEIRPIPPGRKLRLTRADDARRFAPRSGGGLFETPAQTSAVVQEEGTLS